MEAGQGMVAAPWPAAVPPVPQRLPVCFASHQKCGSSERPVRASRGACQQKTWHRVIGLLLKSFIYATYQGNTMFHINLYIKYLLDNT